MALRAAALVLAIVAGPAASLSNLTRARLGVHGSGASWDRFQVQDRHCLLRNTLKYEANDLRWAAEIGEHALRAHGAGTLVDIGANCGVFSLMMAAQGHRALAYDPLPLCVADMLEGRDANGFGERMQIEPLGISDRDESFSVPTTLCSPYFQVGSGQYRAHRRWHALDDISGRAQASSTTLVAALAAATPPVDDVFLLKMDTEGHEPRVLRSGRPLFHAHKIRRMLWELSPAKWARANVSRDDGLRAIADVVDGAGYVTVGRKPAGGGWLPACHADPRVCSRTPPRSLEERLAAAGTTSNEALGRLLGRLHGFFFMPLGAAAFANATLRAVDAGQDSPNVGRNLVSVDVSRSPPPLEATASAPAAAARSPARRSTKERLEELQELRDAGLVSAEEFDAKRRAIILEL